MVFLTAVTIFILTILITFSGSIGSVAITADSEQQLVFITKTKAQKAFVELLKVSFLNVTGFFKF